MIPAQDIEIDTLEIPIGISYKQTVLEILKLNEFIFIFLGIDI